MKIERTLKDYWIIISIMFVAAVLRFHTLGDRSLWMDEIWQVNFYYSDSIRELIDNAATQHAQPPLDYLIGYLLMKVFPFSEMIVRLPATIFGILTVYTVYILTKHLYSRRAAVIASLLTAVSSLLVQYSQEARPYAIFIFALVTMLYLYFRAIEGNRKFYWIMFGISMYFLLLTRGFEPLVAVLLINILTFVYFRLSRKTLLIGMISFVDLILYLPFFRKIFIGLQTFSEPLKHYSSTWNDITYKLQDFPLKDLYQMGFIFTHPFSLIFLILTVLGFFALFASVKMPKGRIFLCFAVLMPVVHILIYTYKVNLSRSPFYPRYYIYVLPFLYIFTASGIEYICQLIRPRLIRPNISYGLAFIFLIFITLYGLNLKGYYISDKDDWRGVSSYIKEKSGDNSIIVTDSPQIEYGLWKPRFEGKYIYYKGVREYYLNKLVDYAFTNPEYKGDIFLVLFYGGINSSNACCKELCREYFTSLCVYKLEDNHNIFNERVEALIDKMIIEYPRNGSRVSLYLNKAKILKSRGKIAEASQFIEKARQLVVPEFAKQLEKEIEGIL